MAPWEQALGGMFAVAARLGMRTLDELARMFDELAVLLREVWEELSARMRGGLVGFSQTARQTLCGLTGHDDQMRAERNHLALSCGRCGRTTSGWQLPESSRSYASPSRHHTIGAGPRYFSTARRRS